MDNMAKLNEYLKKIDDVIENGFYKDNWENFINHKVPEWYRNAKFGIFMHWSVFAVDGMGGGYCRQMYMDPNSKDARFMCPPKLKEMGENENYGYKDFVDKFTAEKFDAGEWADLFKEAGARFVMPVAEHHDGFQMYDSDLSEWCASKKGPKKDIVGLLKEAVEDRGMHLCTSSHRIEHYWFLGGQKHEGTDMPVNPPYGHMYWPSKPLPGKELNDVFIDGLDELFMQDWLARSCEIVDKYQPDIMYFDWWIQVAPLKPYLKKFMAYYYNRALEWGKDVTINYKNDAFIHTSGVKDIERGQLTDISPYFWQNDTSVAKNHWTYTENDSEFKTPREVLEVLIDVVSKNGSLLLNIGPKPDGTITEEETHVLKEVGKWLKVNGDGIYDTYPWRKYGIGPTVTKEGHFTDTLTTEFTSDDFRFTFKNGYLYVFAIKWPEDGVVRIPILGKKSKQFNPLIESLEILGFEGATYKLCDDYLTVMCDDIKTDYPVCIKIGTN